MSYQKIPLTCDANQTFQATLTIGDTSTTLTFTLKYNGVAGYWVMSISDTSGTLLIDSLPLVRGDYPAGNLLGQYAYLGLGSAYIISTGTSDLDYPDDSTLGDEFILIWSSS